MGSHKPIPTISRIAIIGAGPVGLAFAKYLQAEKAFDKIQIFEQRDRVGGIWNLSRPTRSRRIPIPQLNPRYGQETSRSGFSKSSNREINHDKTSHEESLEFESPLYDYLETNIPKALMAYSDKPFSDDLPLFPKHDDVLRYIEEYAEDVKHLVRFETMVTSISVEQSGRNGADEWNVETQDFRTKESAVSQYDAVVVANGHYTVPSVSVIKGVQQWNESYPGSIIHSKAYRKPEDYMDKKVLVIGNSASGLDIAFQVGQKCRQPVLLSSRSVSAFGTAPKAAWRKDVDEVVEFLKDEEAYRGIRLASGSIEEGIDVVIFCTGYFYSYPFLEDLKPPVVDDGLRTKGVYQHLFDIDHPSLVFPVINLKVVPFPLAESQAAVVARVFSGRLSLPTKEKMRAWERAVVKEKGDGKYFHLLKFPEDAAQINELYEWAKQASPVAGLENNGEGRYGMRWDEQAVWRRSKFSEIKAAYSSKGADRIHVKTIEELGFDFNKWRETASAEEVKMFRQAKCSLIKGSLEARPEPIRARSG